MRGSTVALAVIAVVALGALFVTWQGDSSDRQSSSLAPSAKSAGRASGRDRLDSLRGAYERHNQDSGGATLKEKAAPRKAAMDRLPPRQMPTRGADLVEVGEEDLPYDQDDAQEVDELRGVILNDPDPDERIGGILMLSGNEHPEAIATIVKAMDDPEPEVRLAAVEALGDYTETLSANTLEPAMDDPDPEVRFEAISVLGDLETDAAYSLVRKALDDPDEDVRELAEGILEDLDDE